LEIFHSTAAPLALKILKIEADLEEDAGFLDGYRKDSQWCRDIAVPFALWARRRNMLDILSQVLGVK